MYILHHIDPACICACVRACVRACAIAYCLSFTDLECMHPSYAHNKMVRLQQTTAYNSCPLSRITRAAARAWRWQTLEGADFFEARGSRSGPQQNEIQQMIEGVHKCGGHCGELKLCHGYRPWTTTPSSPLSSFISTNATSRTKKRVEKVSGLGRKRRVISSCS